MAENSLIAWTHNTFNPWIGCVKVSEGCRNCYAETLVVNRMGRPGLWGPASKARRARTSLKNWNNLSRWNREIGAGKWQDGAAMRVFAASLADIFEAHPDIVEARRDLFSLIRATPFIQWQLLTKRPELIAEFLPDDWGDYGYPNVWLGTSIESMKVAGRADELRAIPAAVRFISYEPALGPLDDLALDGIDWIIYGGESGPGYRPHDLAWPRRMRDRCVEEDRAFFFKQSPAPRTEMGITLDGEIVRHYPIPRSLTETLKYPDVSKPVRLAMRKRVERDAIAVDAPPTDPRAVARAELPLFADQG
jgi:protein gp37